ncbi:inosine-uridine preferring nucleoside hydrolase-like [Asterias rubens]|uniref:inosine-uridine preferring nucleoside hydrolase-like n=1 Tax=Asterias rubens TaxID=7604 RepID=UPI0014553EA7|nr:inosine-uridine preferring nucleoside hydrolase-like [Asterias rubens]
MSSKNLMVIDCDAGVDDAHAIMVALSSNLDAEVLAITCVKGNVHVDKVWYNVHRVLDACDKKEIPVYQGAASALLMPTPEADFHGKDGLGDAPHAKLTIHPDHHRAEHAVDMLISLANKHPGLISLIAIGPLTNLALAERMDPGFSSKLKAVYIMGGNMHGKGNVTPTAEFNFHQDPEAAYIVLETFQCQVYLLTWELTLATEVTLNCFKDLLKMDTKRSNFLKDISKKSYDIMADKELRPQFGCIESDGWNCCDALASAVAIDPSIITDSKSCPCSISLAGVTRGQLIVDWNGFWGDKSKRTVIMNVNMERYKEILTNSVL